MKPNVKLSCRAETSSFEVCSKVTPIRPGRRFAANSSAMLAWRFRGLLSTFDDEVKYLSSVDCEIDSFNVQR